MPWIHGYGEEDEIYMLKSADGTKTYLEMPRALMEVKGMAMPPMEHRSVRSPFQDGETFLGFSLRPRILQLIIHLRGATRLEMWYFRRDFISRINPRVGSMRFRVSFRDGRIFELHKLRYDAGFEMGTDGQPEAQVQHFPLRFIAYDPVWFEWPENEYSAMIIVEEELVFRIREDGEGTGLIFPIVFPIVFTTHPTALGDGIIFPIVFGTTSILESVEVVASGTWPSYPTFELTGPMLSPKITNETTGEMLELDYKIMDGETVTITTEFGNKSIMSSNGNSLLGYLTPGSDLATFHLEHDPVVEDGINIISFFALECTGDSAITIRWFDRYLGI